MDILALTALLSPCLPVLMKLVDKAAESAGSKIGDDVLKTANKIWEKLYPKIETNEKAKNAVNLVAADPKDEDYRMLLQKQLQKLLDEDQDLAEAIAQIMQKQKSTSDTDQVSVNISGKVAGAVVGQSTGTVVGLSSVEGGISL